MTALSAIGTYLPPWGSAASRVAGPDEDAVTLGVASARALPGGAADSVKRVVFISRDLPLPEGGSAAALLAGVGLDASIAVVEQSGGAPEVLDALACASPGTLIVAADTAPAGAAAALVGTTGAEVTVLARVTRSLPTRTRDQHGVVRDYDDPRLLRDRGFGVAIDRLGLVEKPLAVAGVPARFAAQVCQGTAPTLPTSGASAAVFAVAALRDVGAGTVVACEQGSAVAVAVGDGAGGIDLYRDERPAQTLPTLTHTPGPDIAISLAAYERAFAPKLRWEAGRCIECGTLAFPPRFRCLSCGSEATPTPAPLPRTGSVYSYTDIHVSVPGLPTPYALAVVELDNTDVRALVKVTGVPSHQVSIGDRGDLVLRRIALRSGVPDYGYALRPGQTGKAGR